MSAHRWKRLFYALLVLLCLLSFFQVALKVHEGKTAFVRWMPDTAKLLRGESIYFRGEQEGFPAPPFTALVLVPFHAMGKWAGSAAWFLVKVGAIALILHVVRETWARDGCPPTWRAMTLLLLLSAYVFTGDLVHGNLNLLVAAAIAVALDAVCRGQDIRAGVALAFATALKVTPLLFVPYLAWKRRWRTLGAFSLGLLFFAVIVPGVSLGFGRTVSLTGRWVDQMAAPFVTGADVGLMQTRHDNQSLTGVAYRLLTDSVAIEESRKKGCGDVRVNALALPPRAVDFLLKAAFLGIVGLIAWASGWHDRRSGLRTLGDFSLVFLGMLLISERSWKHHYVLVILPHAFLLRHALSSPMPAMRSPATWLLVAAAACHHLFLGGIWGKFGSDVAEAYGAYVLGAVFLFVGCLWVQRTTRHGSFTVRAPGGSSSGLRVP